MNLNEILGSWGIAANDFPATLHLRRTGNASIGQAKFEIAPASENFTTRSFDNDQLQFTRLGPNQQFAGSKKEDDIQGTFTWAGSTDEWYRRYFPFMKKILIFFFVLLQGRMLCLSQCDHTLTPSQNPTVGYRFRGNRCEGTYSARVNAPSLEIAGFTVGQLTYNLDRNEIIELENPMDFPISVRSSALAINTYYRMDATLVSKETLKWQVKDVLLSLGIPSKSLGVFGWVEADQEKIYLPVKLSTSNFKKADTQLYLIIHSNTKVQGAKYRYASAGKKLGDYKNITNSWNAIESIVIILPNNLTGIYNVEVAAMLEAGSGWIVRQYKFMIQ